MSQLSDELIIWLVQTLGSIKTYIVFSAKKRQIACYGRIIIMISLPNKENLKQSLINKLFTYLQYMIGKMMIGRTYREAVVVTVIPTINELTELGVT